MKALLKYYILDQLILLYKELKLKLWPNHQPIIVHTMAKVGSLSVYNSLQKQKPKTTLFHTHSLDLNQMQNDIDFCFENNRYPGSRSPIAIIHNNILSQQKSFKIITLFRDPVERNISAFFDAFEIYVGMKPQAYTGNLEHLEYLFHKHLPHRYAIEWFDAHFFNDFQINIYDYTFNAKHGYGTIQQNNIKILIMNCHLKDTFKVKKIGEFCNVSNFKLVNANITAEKQSGNLYKDFKTFIRFDEGYLKTQYNSKYAKHFFTETHRIEAIKKWLKPK